MKKVIDYLKNLLNENDTIVVACSGGPDSMCLLDLFVDLKKDININIICAHVNHKHRLESEDEEIKVKEYCEKNNVTFELLAITEYKNDKFTEDEARDKRYIFFNELVKKYGAKYLCTAHHGDDLIETILMRITRGSNLKGYIGFKRENKNEDYTLLRPLIDVTKKVTLEYCKEKNLWYAHDVTNDCDLYTRNRYRHNATPFFKNEDANVHKKFVKFSEELNDYEEFISNYIDSIYNNVVNCKVININKLKEEKPFIQKKLIEKYISIIQNSYKLYINDKHMESILNLINSEVSNSKLNLPNDFEVIKNYNEFKIVKINNTIKKYNYELLDNKNIDGYGTISIVNNSNELSNYVIRINSEEIKLPLIIKCKDNGDKMIVKNMNGAKKIKDIFIDEKVNKEKRDLYPLVCDSDNNIIWIPGIKKSKFDKKTNEKYDIIIKYEEENNE